LTGRLGIVSPNSSPETAVLAAARSRKDRNAHEALGDNAEPAREPWLRSLPEVAVAILPSGGAAHATALRQQVESPCCRSATVGARRLIDRDRLMSDIEDFRFVEGMVRY
jgi:hypothetical protein